MKKRTILSLIISCLFLSGCWDHNEPERLLYINGIGVDYKENGDVEVFMQIINLQGLAKVESGGGPGSVEQSEVGRATGRTMEEAVFNLYHTIDRRAFLGHLSYVILTKEAVTKGAVKDVADLLDRFRETRYRTYFFVTQDPLQEVMLIEPLDNIPLAFSKLSDPIDNYKQSSLIEPIDLRELIIHTDEPGHQVVLPVVKITKQWANKSGNEKDLLMEEVAIVHHNTLQDIIPEKSFQGARGVEQDFIRDLVVFSPGDHHNQHMSVVVYNKKIKVQPVVENGKIRFNIRLKVKGTLQMTKFNMKREEIEKEVAKTIKKEILTAYDYGQKKNIDLFELSTVAYRQKNQAWKKVEKNGLIPLEKGTIKSLDINVRLQTTGRNKQETMFAKQKNEGFKKRYPEE
ncbi:Ger(x)C family spore germination protein [Bacillus benzoevorans]|uniref:Ger(X)C family germination protein n=1 Tax=Bacillus benzoevorans TaxID=1456 RepID=A0A7X0HSM7_9BACI|nr:Ger(x)C family spore germination protein [Bacillus benzoevorans]MBB6446088.1 Ger(x)C family germination protein [Bacillus benzoevorans]